MDPKSVLSKTSKGREEIETRKHKLDQRMRMLLITVNGKQTAGELVVQFSKSGDVTPLLEELLREGFVQQGAVDSGARLKQAGAEIARAVSDALGPDGDTIAMKVEAAKTLDELRQYLESNRPMLDRVLGRARAPAFWAKVSTLL